MPANAPDRFVTWMTNNVHRDPKLPFVYRYHSRSDSHSKAICSYVLDDLLETCPLLMEQAKVGKIVYGINLKHLWPNSSKAKTIDLAIGTRIGGISEIPLDGKIGEGMMGRVIISLEAKSVMTEHGKSQPRVYDELSSSHSIVHASDPEAIAAGVAVVNVASKFASPLRQRVNQPLEFTQHKQPYAAERMVNHLRGLPIRTGTTGHGFDAFATIVIDCDNQGPATLLKDPPAPQLNDRDHYATFLANMSAAYTERFSNV